MKISTKHQYLIVGVFLVLQFYKIIGIHNIDIVISGIISIFSL